MISVTETKLQGVKLIETNAFEDFRGYYLETYNEEEYKKSGVTVRFLQDDISVSSKSVLRGIHGDQETWKLISCFYGKLYLVVLNYNEASSQFGQWESFVLSDENKKQVLIPPGFGNGHLVLSEQAMFHYKQSTYYNPKGQFTVKWNDPRFNIWWPIKNPLLSRRDEEGNYV